MIVVAQRVGHFVGIQTNIKAPMLTGGKYRTLKAKLTFHNVLVISFQKRNYTRVLIIRRIDRRVGEGWLVNIG